MACLFAGLVFCFSGVSNESNLKKLVQSHGGRHYAMISPMTTHMVTTREEVESKSQRVISALRQGSVLIVSPDLIHDSIAQNKLIDEQPYLLAQGNPSLRMSAGGGVSAASARPKGWWKASFVKAKAWQYQSKGEPYFPADFEIVKSDILQWTDVINNFNKYYSIEFHKAVENGKEYHRLFTHYGRTDDLDKDPTAGRKETRYYANSSQAEAAYAALIEEKTDKRRYHKVDMASGNIGSDKARARYAAPVTSEQSSAQPSGIPSSLHPMVRYLVDYIYSEATSRLTATVSAKITARGIETPLGVLTLAQVEKGEAILDELQSLYEAGQLSNDKAAELSSKFYTVIPHPIGRSKLEVMASILKTPEAFEQKRELLQLMKDMVQLNSAGGGALHSAEVDNKYRALRCQVSYVEPDDYTHERIRNHVLDSQVKSHDIQVLNVYALKREVEQSRFTSDIPDQRLLFHGSKISNWVGLLSRGMLMPKSVTALGGKRTDYGLLGAGLYFGGESCTSAQYTSAGAKGTRFMLLNTVALGKIYEVFQVTPGLTEPPEGYNSVQGVSARHGRPSAFKDDEFVIYNLEQQKMDFLVEFRLMSTDPVHTPPTTQLIPTPLYQPQQPIITTPAAKRVMSPPKVKKRPENKHNNDKRTVIQESTKSLEEKEEAAKEDRKTAFEAESGARKTPAVSSNFSHTDSYKHVNRAQDVVTEVGSLYTDYARLITSEQNELKNQEDYYRGLFAQDCHNPILANLYLNMINVHNERESFKFQAETDPKEKGIPKILAQKRPDLQALDGQYSVVDVQQWNQNWQDFTQGQFEGLNWRGIFVAGGSVLSCLDPDYPHVHKGSDIDLFLYDTNENSARGQLRHIFDTVQKNTKGKGDIIRTKNAITIINSYPYRHIQIILRLYKSPAEVLMGFDIDSCTVGFDGQDVWALPRACRAINKCYNLLDLSRRSLTYESRLQKYAKRGFAVAVPGLDHTRVDPQLYKKALKSVGGLAKLLIMDLNAIKAQSKAEASPTKDGVTPKSRSKRKKKASDADPLILIEKEESDYSEVNLPWGPDWIAGGIMSLLNRQDKAAFFSTIRKNKAAGEKRGQVSHIFVSGIEAVLNDSNRMGPLVWLTDNPGRQLLTGSFHPVDDQDYERDAYVPWDQVPQGRRAPSTAGGDPRSPLASDARVPRSPQQELLNFGISSQPLHSAPFSRSKRGFKKDEEEEGETEDAAVPFSGSKSKRDFKEEEEEEESQENTFTQFGTGLPSDFSSPFSLCPATSPQLAPQQLASTLLSSLSPQFAATSPQLASTLPSSMSPQFATSAQLAMQELAHQYGIRSPYGQPTQVSPYGIPSPGTLSGIYSSAAPSSTFPFSLPASSSSSFSLGQPSTTASSSVPLLVRSGLQKEEDEEEGKKQNQEQGEGIEVKKKMKMKKAKAKTVPPPRYKLEEKIQHLGESADLIQKVFSLGRAPQSRMAKLLLLVSNLHKSQHITLSEKASLKDLIIQDDPAMARALDDFEATPTTLDALAQRLREISRLA